MTSIYFVRHAQPDKNWDDDRTKPLTQLGKDDSKKVTEALKDLNIDIFYSSPYKRSFDTILDCANSFNMTINTDERFRERKQGINSIDFLEKRWEDFDFCEESGESMNCLQQRNIEALHDILKKHPNQNIVIGTHGAALSSIMNFYNPSFKCDDFKRIWFSLPYIIRLDFDGECLVQSTELLKIDREY